MPSPIPRRKGRPKRGEIVSDFSKVTKGGCGSGRKQSNEADASSPVLPASRMMSGKPKTPLAQRGDGQCLGERLR